MTSSNLSLSWSFFYFNTRNIQASGFHDSGMQEAGTNGSICLLQIHRQNNLSGAGGAERSHTKGKATRICSQPHIVVLYKKKMKPKKREEVKDERKNSIWSVQTASLTDKSTWGSCRNYAVNEIDTGCIYLNELLLDHNLVMYKSFLFSFYLFIYSFHLHGLAMISIIKAHEFIQRFTIRLHLLTSVNMN